MPYDAISCLSRDGRDACGAPGRAAAIAAALRRPARAVPLGIDDDLLSAAGDRDAARRRLQIPADAVALLVLGRITPAQKMDLAPLLKAFARQILPRAARRSSW